MDWDHAPPSQVSLRSRARQCTADAKFPWRTLVMAIAWVLIQDRATGLWFLGVLLFITWAMEATG